MSLYTLKDKKGFHKINSLAYLIFYILLMTLEILAILILIGLAILKHL